MPAAELHPVEVDRQITDAFVYKDLISRRRDDFFRSLGTVVDTYFEHHPDFAPLRDVLGGKRAGEVVKTVNTSDFSQINPFEKKEEYQTLLTVAEYKERFRRAIIVHELDHDNTLGLNPWERVIVRGFCDIANVLDEISTKWREDVVWSKAGVAMGNLDDEEKMLLPQRLEKLGFNHAYAVLVPEEESKEDPGKLLLGEEGHGYKEVPYTIKYEDEYKRLAGILDVMVSQLESLDETSQRNQYMRYLWCWKQLCEEKELRFLDNRAEELDSLWMDLPDGLLLVHPMEYGYYGEDGIRKDQVAFLGIADSSLSPLMASCEEQKSLVRDYFREETPQRGEFPVLTESLKTLDERTRFLSLVKVTGSMGYDFRPAAESLPNSDHQKVTDTQGKRILVFPEGCQNSWRRRLDTGKRVFGEEGFHMFDDLTMEDWIAYEVATHETGETVSRNLTSDQRLGNYRTTLNEDKATTAGLSYKGKLSRGGKLSQEEAEKIAKLNILSNIFFLSAWGSPQREPYYREGVILINLALKIGLLRYSWEEERWIPDFSKSKDYLKLLEAHFWEDQAPLWESGAEAAATLGSRLWEKLGKESEEIRFLIAWERTVRMEELLLSQDREVVTLDDLIDWHQRRLDNENEAASLYEKLGLPEYQANQSNIVSFYETIVRSLQGDGNSAYITFLDFRRTSRRAIEEKVGAITAVKGEERAEVVKYHLPRLKGARKRFQRYDLFLQIIAREKGLDYTPLEIPDKLTEEL